MKLSKNDKGEIHLSQSQVLEFLEDQGFRNIKTKQGWRLARIQTNIVEYIQDTMEVRKFIIDFIKSNFNPGDRSQVINKALSLFKHIKRSGLLDGLKEEELGLITEDQNTCYKFFRNTVVRITQSGIEFIEYANLPGYVLKTSILERDFTQVDENEIWNSPFANFLYRCMMADETSFFALLKALGYLSCSYNSSKDNKAVVFCDDDFEDIPNGGTGKSLTALALSHFNNAVIEDGKNFKYSSFVFQQVDSGTKLLIIDDAMKTLDFESLFSSISGGLIVEKKYQDKYRLDLQDSPKFLITTNYTILGKGYSFERRIYEVEFSPYYGPNKSPLDEFGIEFFSRWDSPEWNRFDNLMLFCIQLYLRDGLAPDVIKDSTVKKIKRQTSLDFYYFIIEYGLQGEITKRNLFNHYLNDYPNAERWLTIRKFNSWIRTYCSIMQLEYHETKIDGGQRSWLFS